MKSISLLIALGLASSAMAEPIPVRRQYTTDDDCTNVTAGPIPATSTFAPIPFGTGYSYGSGSGGPSSSEASPEQGSSSSASYPKYTGSYSYGTSSSSVSGPVSPSAGPSGSYPIYGNGSSSQVTAGPGSGIPGSAHSITSTVDQTTTITLTGSLSASYPSGSSPAAPATTGNQTSPVSPTGSVPAPYSYSASNTAGPVTPSSNSTLPQPTSSTSGGLPLPSSYPSHSYGTGIHSSSSTTNDTSPVTGTISSSSSASILTDSFTAPAYTVSVSPILPSSSAPIGTGYPSYSTNSVSPVTGSGSSFSSSFATVTSKPYGTNTPYAVPSYGYNPGGYSALPYSHEGHQGQGDAQAQNWWGSWFGQH